MKINNPSNFNIYPQLKAYQALSKSVSSMSTDSIDKVKQWEENEKNKNSSPRWDLVKVPIKFYISTVSDPDTFLPEFIEMIEKSFHPWSAASYGKIRFIRTYNYDEADIMVNWANQTLLGRDFEAGHSNQKIVNNRIEKAEITIITLPAIDKNLSKAQRIERVRRTALHEIGHILGLNHSNSSKDMMFHRGINNKTLSENDIRRLNDLYSGKNPNIVV